MEDAGKSTLLNLLGGLDSPTSGTIRVNGRDISTLTNNELADYRAATVGFVFQFYNLIPTLTVYENVALVNLCLRLADKAAIGDTIEFSPYGSEETYKVKVAGYVRSLMSECIMMTDEYAAGIGLDYHIGSIYTDRASESIEESSLISGKQDKDMIMDTYDTFWVPNMLILRSVSRGTAP